MIDTSYKWREAYRQRIVPETFVEITMAVENDVSEQVTSVVSGNPGRFRNEFSIIHNHHVAGPQYYATLENNLWVLDGTRRILPNPMGGTPTAHERVEYYNNPGYVSANSAEGWVELRFNTVIDTATPGMTITWSSEYNEYPTSFMVTTYVNKEIVQTIEVTGNDSNVSVITDELVGYDAIEVRALDWSFPNHRRRIDQVFFGQNMTMRKNDIISYEHEQSGDLLSAALPKNSITFSLDNTDGRWNPNNPSGWGKYLAERQRLTVRYGMDIDGAVEWIDGGKFYLSEWNAPSNGLEARFVARDIFEFLLDAPSESYSGLTLADVIDRLVVESGLSDDVWVYSDDSIKNTVWVFDDELGVAENIQMIANQYRCVFWQDRAGDIHLVPLDTTISNYPVSLEYAYSHPEITLSKPLKEVIVKYTGNKDADDDDVLDEATYTLRASSTGESQTVTNKRIASETEAKAVAEWVRDVLLSRKIVSGEFRADPRLDVFDIVEVESKYGTVTPVAITNIKYTYNGSFRGHYEGRVITIPEVE